MFIIAICNSSDKKKLQDCFYLCCWANFVHSVLAYNNSAVLTALPDCGCLFCILIYPPEDSWSSTFLPLILNLKEITPVST